MNNLLGTHSRYVSLLLALMVLMLTRSWAQDPTIMDASQLLDQMDKKIGEVEKRRSFKSVVMEGSIAVASMPEKGKNKEVWRGQNEVNWTTDWMMGSSSQGRDGTMCWTTDPAMGIYILRGDEMAPVARFYATCRLAPWRTIYETGVVKGKKDIDGRPCHVVELTPKIGKPVNWFIDVESHLLAAVELELPDMMGGWLKMTFEFSDWKEVNGIRFPHQKKQKVGAYSLNFAFDRINYDTALVDADVLPPKKVVEAAAKPRRKSSVPPEKPGECFVESIDARHTLHIRAKIPVNKISENLSIMLPEVSTYISKNNFTMAGPPYSRYHTMTADIIDLEAGIPVALPAKGEGRIQSGELPAGPTAITWHFGVYQDLSTTHALLSEWVKTNKHVATGPVWEIYWTDPGIEPDPTKWRTQIFMPVK